MGFWSTIDEALEAIEDHDFQQAEKKLEKALTLSSPAKFKHQVRGMLPVVRGLKHFQTETYKSNSGGLYMRKMADMLLHSPLVKNAQEQRRDMPVDDE